MSLSFNCKCPERDKPVADRKWVVTQRNSHNSAFSGYQWTPSDYSTVVCHVCFCVGRTKAAYVASLPDGGYRPEPPKERVT